MNRTFGGNRGRARRIAGKLARIAARLSKGEAGTIRRALDVPALLASQIALLQPSLRDSRAQEDHYLVLLDEIAARLNNGKSTPLFGRTFG